MDITETGRFGSRFSHENTVAELADTCYKIPNFTNTFPWYPLSTGFVRDVQRCRCKCPTCGIRTRYSAQKQIMCRQAITDDDKVTKSGFDAVKWIVQPWFPISAHCKLRLPRFSGMAIMQPQTDRDIRTNLNTQQTLSLLYSISFFLYSHRRLLVHSSSLLNYLAYIFTDHHLPNMSETLYKQVDVLIIGAGLSGLQSAVSLHEAGFSVLVLEARDRVGGKTWSRDFSGGISDMGAAWINSTNQSKMYALAQRFGLETIVQNTEGEIVMHDLDGSVHTFPYGGVPDVGQMFGTGSTTISKVARY
jgi:hypothetical protein